MSATTAARDCLRRGWAPVPMPPGTKIPVISNWQNFRATEAEIEADFPADWNIGLLTGGPSKNLADVDLDVDQATPIASRLLPPTDLRHGRISRPTSHVWYSTDVPTTTTQFKDPTDKQMLVELRGTGAQTVIPPSRHPSGERLSWVCQGEPGRVALADLEGAVRRVAAGALLARHYPEKSRQEFSLALIGFLLRGGMTEESVLEFVLAVAHGAGPGASRGEDLKHIKTNVASTAKKLRDGKPVTGGKTLAEFFNGKTVIVDRIVEWLGLRVAHSSEPEAWPDPLPFDAPVDLPEFPLETLPDVLGQFVKELSACVQIDPIVAALLVLGVVASCVQRKFVAAVGDTHSEPLPLDVTVVLQPGDRKSETFARVTAPLEEIEKSVQAAARPKVEAATQKRAIEEEVLKSLRGAAGKAKSEKDRNTAIETALKFAASMTQTPALPKLMVSETTPERLATLIFLNGGRQTLVDADGEIFGIMGGRYSKGGTPNLGVFLKSHAGDTLRVERGSRPDEHVFRPALTMLVATQPGVIAGMADQPSFRGRGMIGRQLFAVPASQAGRRKYKNVSVTKDAASAYHRAVEAIYNLPGAGAPDEPDAFHRILITGAALEEWIKSHDRFEAELAPGGRFESMPDWASKAPGAVARISAILHVVRHRDASPWLLEVDVTTVASAATIVEVLAEHALAAYGLMETRSDVAQARKILAWLGRETRPKFTLRDCHQVFRAVGRPEDLLPGLAVLEGRGFIRRLEPEPREGPGRRRSPLFEIHPLALNTQNPQNTTSAGKNEAAA